MKTATITLPWPPSVNTYWRSVIVGRRVNHPISKKGNAYRSAVAAEVKRCWPDLTRPTNRRLTVWIQAWPPDRRQRDLDNLPKAVLDALTKCGVWVDDGQIDDLRITRRKVVPNGRITVEISTLEGDVK